MRLGIIITTNDAETAWNALRLARFSLAKGDEVKIFLLGKGVEIEEIENEKFDVKRQIKEFLQMKGEILACGTCLELRKDKGSKACKFSSMYDLYEIINQSDRVITF